MLEAAEVTKLDVALALHIRLEAQAVVELQVAVQQHTVEVMRLYARHHGCATADRTSAAAAGATPLLSVRAAVHTLLMEWAALVIGETWRWRRRW